MADRAERQRYVAGEAADIGALGDMGAEGDAVYFLPGTGRIEWIVTLRVFISTSSPFRARS